MTWELLGFPEIESMTDRAIGLSRPGESQVAMRVMDELLPAALFPIAQPQLPPSLHRQRRHSFQPNPLPRSHPPGGQHAVFSRGAILRSAVSLHRPRAESRSRGWRVGTGQELRHPSSPRGSRGSGATLGRGKRKEHSQHAPPTASPSLVPFSPCPVLADSLPSRHCAPPQSVQRSGS